MTRRHFAKGFTVVELLVVIVVIAILATMVFVSYKGVKNTAKTSQAKTNAYAVQKVAESFFADKNRLPGTVADFSYNPLTKVPSGVTLLTDGQPLSTDNGSSGVEYNYLGTSTAATGGRVRFWDFSLGKISDSVLYVGTANASSTGWQGIN